jgi:hypothetical protein
MVAKISTGKDIVGLINYNENKVEQGQARLIAGANLSYGKGYREMSYEQKLEAFSQIIERKKNKEFENTTFHVSLSFDPEEKLTDGTLKEIAGKYIKAMGYERQPYLVYRHEDTILPHMHIVSTRVNREGKKIDSYEDRIRSELIRKKLEEEYGLLKASKKILTEIEPLKKLEYGKEETKKGISNAIRGVLEEHRASSFKEFKTLLAGYNVKAEHIRGTSKRGNYEGVAYSATNDKGRRLGRTIKASSFQSKPTLKNLQVKFEENREVKKEEGEKMLKAIEKVLNGYESITREDLQEKLFWAGINLQYQDQADGVNSNGVSSNRVSRNELTGISLKDQSSRILLEVNDLGKDFDIDRFASRLSDKTVEKWNISTMDRNTLDEAILVLDRIFLNLKKDEQIGEFFESRMIRKVDTLDLVIPLLKQMPELDLRAGEGIAAHYKGQLKNSLEQIEGKEKESFSKGVEALISFLEQMPPSIGSKEKLLFLNRHHLQVRIENESLIISHSKGDHLKEARYEQPLANHLGEGRLYNNLKLTPYTLADKAFIEDISKGKINLQNRDILSFPYFHFKPLLSEKNDLDLANYLTRDYSEKLLRGFEQSGLGGNTLKLVEELEKRGLQIKPGVENGKVVDYRLQYIAFPQGSIQVSEPMREALMKSGYNKEPTSLTNKYNVLVGLYQSLDRKDIGGVEWAIKFVEKIDPLFGKTLRNELEPLRAATLGDSTGTEISEKVAGKEKMTLNMLTHLISRISVYGANNLKEGKHNLVQIQKEGAKGEERNALNTSPSYALANLKDEGGKDSHQLKNERPKGPRPG